MFHVDSEVCPSLDVYAISRSLELRETTGRRPYARMSIQFGEISETLDIA